MVVSIALLGLIFGTFQTSTRFLSRSTYSKKPEIVLNVNSAMQRLRAGVIGPDKVIWKNRAINYSASLDTTKDDSLVYYVRAQDSKSKNLLFALRQTDLKAFQTSETHEVVN